FIETSGPPDPQSSVSQAMRLFATAYIKASWMRSTGANRTSGARAGAQSQIGWLSFPGTSSDIRTAQVGADRANVLWGAMLPRSDSCCYSEFARCTGCGAPCRETKLCGRQQ